MIHPVATNVKEHKIHYYIHIMTKGLCNLCPILTVVRKQIDHSTWDLSVDESITHESVDKKERRWRSHGLNSKVLENKQEEMRDRKTAGARSAYLVLDGLLSIVVTVYTGSETLLFEFKYISMFSICVVEPTQPASARKSMANGSEAIEAIRVIRSKKYQAGENSWQTHQIARLREHEILLLLKDHGGTRNSPLFAELTQFQKEQTLAVVA
ncbi:hypothetical protein B0H13DRAFT_1867107 [Mycena leptocephala]|nr:hypothetical protein B0H13DRAFT_1867107 [Mycena leptocephala]